MCVCERDITFMSHEGDGEGTAKGAREREREGEKVSEEEDIMNERVKE